MGRYENTGNYLNGLDSTWGDDKFRELGTKTTLKTLYRRASRENLVRALDLASGTALENTFSPEGGGEIAGHRQTGQRFADLLELVAREHDAKKEAQEEKSDAEPGEQKEQVDSGLEKKKTDIALMIQNVYIAGHYDFPGGHNPLANLDSPTWATDALDYMYYMAVRKMAEQRLPDIDYQDPKQLKEHADACKAYGNIMLDLAQISDGAYTEHLAEKYPDFKQRKEDLSRVALAEQAIAVLGTEPVKPQNKKQMIEYLQARIIVDQYGEHLRGKTCQEAAKDLDFRQLAGMPVFVTEFLETLKWTKEGMLDVTSGEKERMAADYLDRKPNSFCPIIVKGDQMYLSPVFDKRIPKLNLDQVKEEFVKGSKHKAEIFDKLFDQFPDDPTHNTEPAYKRIYIDGKNAYDLFKGNYKGTEQEIEAAVKADIMDTLTKGVNRVELARMVQQRDGQVKAHVVPVRADLKVLDANKRWYQHSLAKQEEKLWTDDPEAVSRRAAIATEAQTRHQDNFYRGILEAANAVRREYMGTEPGKKADFLEAERRMKAEPDLAREWGIQKLAQAYKKVKEVPKVLRDSSGHNILYEDAVSAVQIVSAAQEGISSYNMKDLAIGRQFQEYIDITDKMIAMEMPDEFYQTYELEQLRENRKVFQRRWDREDQASQEKPLTAEEQAYRAFKRGETLADMQEEAGRRFADKLLPYADALADQMNLLENRDIIAMGDDARRAELDEHFLGTYRHYNKLSSEGRTPYSEASAYEPFQRVRACNEKVIETVAAKIKDKFNLDAVPEVCRNQFRAIRQVMESIGLDQQEVDSYAEKLNPEQRSVYEYVRSWERNLVRQSEQEPITLPEGIASTKDALDAVVDIYKNAYYDKLGIVNRKDPYFMDKLQEKVKVPEDIMRMKQAECELLTGAPGMKIPGPNPEVRIKTNLAELMKKEKEFREKNDRVLAIDKTPVSKMAKSKEEKQKEMRGMER